MGIDHAPTSYARLQMRNRHQLMLLSFGRGIESDGPLAWLREESGFEARVPISAESGAPDAGMSDAAQRAPPAAP